jgi:hypothetical protein
MSRIIKLLLLIIVIGILISASAYIVLYTNDDTDDDNGESDTQAPEITDSTGDLTITAGQTATITVLFDDNENVTNATLFYKVAGASSWSLKSILSGSATITIPSSATSNYYYYITVDDAAGNGPIGDPSVDGSLYYVIIVKPGGGNNDNETLAHTVFIEEGTGPWCNNCPNVANILHSIYESHDLNFYYVALINDSNNPNTVADERLQNDYNIYGYPTVFIDGGYSVIIGGNKNESVYRNAIAAAQERPIPKIKVSVTAEYKNTSSEVTVTTVIENKGDNSYSGRLKLYLTEIISQVKDYSSKPYQYGFLEYLFNEDITISGKGNETYSETKNLSGYDYENLMIIAVVFSSEKQQGYANPSDSTVNLFDAYYADATNATTVVEGGNLPPQIQITSPQKGKIYRNSNRGILQVISDRNRVSKKMENISIIKKLMYNKTFIFGFGKITITANASDDSAVSKVVFSIDGTVYYNDTEAPYEWTFKRISPLLQSLRFKNHTLIVTVYDDTGKSNSAELVFKARI